MEDEDRIKDEKNKEEIRMQDKREHPRNVCLFWFVAELGTKEIVKSFMPISR